MYLDCQPIASHSYLISVLEEFPYDVFWSFNGGNDEGFCRFISGKVDAVWNVTDILLLYDARNIFDMSMHQKLCITRK